MLWILFCTVIALCFSKKDFGHLFVAIPASIGLTPIIGYYFYRWVFSDEVEAERYAKRYAKRLKEAARREQAVKDWYISRIPDNEVDCINSLPTHAERLRAAQQSVDRIIEADRRNPNAPEPPYRRPYDSSLPDWDWQQTT
jgi:hypothetical protein